MWEWVKTLTNTKHYKFFTNLTCGLGLVEKSIAIVLNKLIAKINGFKRNKIKNNDYTSRVHYDIKQKHNWIQRQLTMAYWPGFAFHLSCWEIYTLPTDYNPLLRKLYTKLMLSYCEKENYLCRLLLGDKTVTWEEVEAYEAREGFRWQAYLDGSWPNYNGEKPQEWKDKYLKWNQLDKDCLIRIWNNEMLD